jgi:hypothetical protein
MPAAQAPMSVILRFATPLLFPDWTSVMPFHTPFEIQFNPGDLVYGLFDEVARYASKYPHFFSSRAPDISRINQYAATATERSLQQKYQRKVPANQDRFLASIQSHPKYNSVFHETGLSFYSTALHHHKVIARKCKAGLSWASSSDLCVHFILDGLDMAQVVGKNHALDVRERSITGVELRWVYRNRHNQAVRRCIQFWMNGLACPPPWEGASADIWKNYVPTAERPPELSTFFIRL